MVSMAINRSSFISVLEDPAAAAAAAAVSASRRCYLRE